MGEKGNGRGLGGRRLGLIASGFGYQNYWYGGQCGLLGPQPSSALVSFL